MVIYEEGVCDDSVRASPYCNKTDVEFDHLFADKKESNRFLGLYTKCQITFGEKECFHYCSTGKLQRLFTACKIYLDGCNNRHSRNPLEPVVVDYEIVEPEMEIMTPEIFDETTVLMPEDVAAPITVQVEVTDGISRLKSDYSHSAKVIMSTVLTCLLLVWPQEFGENNKG